MGAKQSLYQGIMGALGYSKDKLPFLKLAHRLPIQILESITQGSVSDEDCLIRQQALLFGFSSLLPSQRQDWHHKKGIDDPWVAGLEKHWASCHHAQALSTNAWCLFKVRPSNSPVRRLAAMSYLTLRYREKGMLERLTNLIKGALVGTNSRRLEKGLLVTADGYWASHFDFGPGSRLKNSTLLGFERAADIIVNVLLPFVSAWSQFTSQIELERKALDLYHHYPKLITNSIERHMMSQLGLSKDLINSAQQQQGLIHIYRNLCTQGKCDDCRLGQFQAGNNIQI
jgi:hypothetical protein